ncbi:metallophosphoesterase family protein [Falsiroseomonas selenitidurans]|uniref:DNA repair exonuclease n=1 Tax=Falsiroseomonas selenitidurans TaxID=2716335 RepID=A0ABX1E4A7_9PROT|nr:DNA repair exonuclease [Falsiroseomonas selenitidurans]NKC31833.1 DNA repair exonuclease [Falsiroseomonas selenitidurans]
MKFLHAADIHLDSPLSGLQSRADLPPDLLRDCTRRAFAAMIDLAIAEEVAFVIIAGDLYDGDWKDFSTGLFVAAQMKRLGRPCFLLRGNHDARSVITRDLALPANVFEFSTRTCQTHEVGGLSVVLHGHSFPNRAVPEDLTPGYPEPRRGWLNIGVLHTSGNDPGEHETYAPCDPGLLRLKGYDYWALGHIHRRQVLAERPWIVFPGNTQGRHIRETGAKGCSLVTVEEGQVVAVEHRAVDNLRWALLEVEAAEEAPLASRLAEAVGRALAEAEDRPVLARLLLTGEALPGLATDAERLAAECRNAAIEAGGTLFIEAVRLRTRPRRGLEAAALDPLRAAFEAGLADPARSAALLADLATLRAKVPAPAREALDLPQDAEGLARLGEEAWALAAAAIAAEQPG